MEIGNEATSKVRTYIPYECEAVFHGRVNESLRNKLQLVVVFM